MELPFKCIGSLGRDFWKAFTKGHYKLNSLSMGFSMNHSKEVKIEYLGVEVGVHRLDLVVADKIIVELKAVKEITDVHFAQVLSYLKGTDLKVGLLLNFAKPTLEVRRVVY